MSNVLAFRAPGSAPAALEAPAPAVMPPLDELHAAERAISHAFVSLNGIDFDGLAQRVDAALKAEADCEADNSADARAQKLEASALAFKTAAAFRAVVASVADLHAALSEAEG